ncbi:hypothetical protein LSAT2_016304 [Lamellibrachia satsuma]|nr:hypothetical protein LSAT2_016304 [Lamellibrachia satsuma]
MAASIERSRDMQMRRCDVVGHVTALDQSEPSTQLYRSAPWRTKLVIAAVVGGAGAVVGITAALIHGAFAHHTDLAQGFATSLFAMFGRGLGDDEEEEEEEEKEEEEEDKEEDIEDDEEEEEDVTAVGTASDPLGSATGNESKADDI